MRFELIFAGRPIHGRASLFLSAAFQYSETLYFPAVEQSNKASWGSVSLFQSISKTAAEVQSALDTGRMENTAQPRPTAPSFEQQLRTNIHIKQNVGGKCFPLSRYFNRSHSVGAETDRN